MHRDIVNFVVVTRSVLPAQPNWKDPNELPQDRFRRHNVDRRPLEILEKDGERHRVCQALPRPPRAHSKRIRECGWCDVRQHRSGRHVQGVRRDQLWYAHPPPCVLPEAASDLWMDEKLDLINMIDLGFTPGACCWVHRRGQAQPLLAVYVARGSDCTRTRILPVYRSARDTPTIRIYDGRGPDNPLHTIETLHKSPVHVLTVRPPLPTPKTHLIGSP